MERRKQLLALLTFLPLLAACSAHAGKMPFSYGGNRLTINEEAIHAYQSNQEISKQEKQAYYPALFPDYMTRDTLPFPEKMPRHLAPHSQDGEVWIGSEQQTVGEDFPEGRYVIVSVPFQPAGNLMIHEKGELVFEQAFYSSGTTTVEVNLYEGQKVNMVGPKHAILFAHPDPSLSPYQQIEDRYILSSGIWKVGDHLPAGSYRLTDISASSSGIPFLYVIASDGTYRLYELLSSRNQPQKLDISVRLQVGETIYLGQLESLSFSRAE